MFRLHSSPALIALLPLVAIAASQLSTKAAITEYFTMEEFGPRLERTRSGVSLEICFDSCDYYQGAHVAREADLWDLAFLHQYYFSPYIDRAEFRNKYAALAEPTLMGHASACASVKTELLPECVVTKLARKLKVTYSAVMYDEGYRCQSAGRLTDRGRLGKTVCKDIRSK